MKKCTALFLAAAMLFGLLAGCGSGEAETTGSGSSGSGGSGDPVTVTIAKTLLPAHVDPVYFGSADCGEIIAMNAAGLYYKDADNHIQLDLADSVEESEDGLTLTFTLGEHYFYNADGSQGPRITAQDFVYSAQRAIDPIASNDNQDTNLMNAGVKNAAAVYNGTMDASELGISAPDENTLVIEFDYYVSYREELLAALNWAPQNQEFVESCGAEYGTSASTILNSGAWLVTDFSVGGTSLTLTRNENFAGYMPEGTSSNVDTMTFVLIQDSQQTVLAYQNGDVDIVELTGEQVVTYQDDPAFVTKGASSVSYLAINCETYDNVNLRLALSHALDKNALCEQVLLDGSIPAYFIVPYGLALDAEGNDFRDSAGTYGELDLELAQQYWETAKEEMGIDTLALDFLITSDEAAYTVGAWIQNQYQTALEGLTINLVTVPFEEKMDYVMAGDYGFSVVTWGGDYSDANAFLACYVTDYPINVSKWSNAEYDAILEECTTGDLAADDAGRATALQEAERIFMSEASIVPLYQVTDCFLVRTNVTGINYHLVGVNYDYRTINA